MSQFFDELLNPAHACWITHRFPQQELLPDLQAPPVTAERLFRSKSLVLIEPSERCLRLVIFGTIACAEAGRRVLQAR